MNQGVLVRSISLEGRINVATALEEGIEYEPLSVQMEGYRQTAFEADDPETGKEVVPPRPALGKIGQVAAEALDRSI